MEGEGEKLYSLEVVGSICGAKKQKDPTQTPCNNQHLVSNLWNLSLGLE